MKGVYQKLHRTPSIDHHHRVSSSTKSTQYMSVALISTVLSLGAAWFYFSPNRRQGRISVTIGFGFVMIAAVGLHSLLILSNLALHRPPNLFRRLGIPINAPVDRIRSLLMSEAGFNTIGQRGAVTVPPEIPKDVETLLARLGVHGSRDAYVRFGQRAIQTCSYCSSTTDYTILILSGILLEYLRTATLLLLLTTNINGRQRWRTHVLGVLTCAFLAEFYAFTSVSAAPLDRDAVTAFMWHDNLFLARNVLLMALPVFTQVLPAVYPPPSASVILAQAIGRLERTFPRAQLVKYFRQAILRHPYSRERAVEFWANEAADGATARSDPNVQTTASKLGFGFASPAGSGDKGEQESALRVNARMAVQSLKPLFMPPAN